MRKKLIILITLVVSVVLVAAISAFAYFKLSSDKDITVNHSLTNDIKEISSFSDFVKYSKATEYNDHNESSELSNDTAARRTLKFTTDIILHNNVEITTDCNIDLNGNKLYLNGYNLYFNHGYYGTFQFYSSSSDVGKIYPKQIVINDDVISEATDATSGSISINTPHAIVITNNLMVYSIAGSALQLNDYVITVSMNNSYVGYNALYLVADALVDYSDIRPSKLIPSQIRTGSETGITLTNNVYEFDSSLFIPERTNGNVYSFVYRDIDLPFNYLDYKDITIEYESSNENVISNFGEVTLPSSSNDVTLTANVKMNDEIIATTTFNLKVINPSSDAILNAAKEIIYSRIQDHYDSTEELYVFNREILLPSKVGDATISYTPYKVSTQDGATTLFDGDSTKYLSLGPTNVTTYNDYLVDFSPTSESAALEVKIVNGATSNTFYIKMTSANMIVNNEASIAKDIINEWYGGKISLKKTNGVYDTKELYTFDDIDTEHKYPSVTALNYTIINDTHSLYYIDDTDNDNIDDELGVNTGKQPEAYVDNVMLSCNFTINGKNVSIQIPIVIDSGSSSLANAFLPYYTYYDELIKYGYNNYISQTFELPLAYSDKGPIICYDFALVPNNYASLEDKTLSINPAECEGLVVKLYYNGLVRKTFTLTEGTSYTTAFDSALTELGVTLQQVLAYGDAKWIYSFDITNIPNSNTNLALIYNYKMSAGATGWTTFCENDSDDQKITKFTLAGVLHLGTDVVSEVFYKWIYDNFTIITDDDGNKLTYSTGDYADAIDNSEETEGKYIIIDWLEQNVSIDITKDNTIASITDFTGLQFLVGTKYLDLTGAFPASKAEDAINVAREIAKMTNLETLILKNNKGFTDGKIVYSAEDYDNDSVSRFSKLKKLKKLDLENCNIMLFDFLDEMTCLSEVNVVGNYYNNDSTDYFNNFYGSEGICNFTTYGDLIDAGVKVYVKRQGSGLTVFEAEATVNDYMRLRNAIVYQSKAAYGVDIANLYSSFSTNYLDYHFEKFYNESFPPSEQNVSFAPLLETKYVKATGSYDSNVTYYVVDADSTIGYAEVANPVSTDFDNYYIAEVETNENCKAFIATYSFVLNSTAHITLKVKFKVERYEI